MLYSAEITELRNQVGDIPRRVHVDFIGDAATTVFQLPSDTFPVLESSYTVKVAGAAQVESTNYSIDRDAGTIRFLLAAPGNGVAVTFDGVSVYLTDASWLAVINATIKSLGDDYWKEFIDESVVSTANMTSLSLVSAQVNCIAVYQFQRRASSTSDWRGVEEDVNWRYDRDNNIIYIGKRDAFPSAGEALRIRGLKTYTLGAATSATIDVQDKYMTVIEYGCVARYWRWRYKAVVELVSKQTSETSRTPLQELMMLSDRFDRLYEQEKARLKPGKPARIIPPVKDGGGRP